ncbi:MAG: 50S ribosomal protein L4 [Parcubacteria group bacterium]|nr:50S ribosomal protein L4 [Parcubacteria group bacterium]
MISVDYYNQKGEKVGTLDLSEKIFGLKFKADLVHQVLTAVEANQRKSIAHTKNRAEVSGGGKKPWKQKGTGRARQGSIRSPIFRHGGVVFGPRKEKNFSQDINKKMRRKALLMVLSAKLNDQEILFLDNIKIKEPKTRLMAEFFNNFLSKVIYSSGRREGEIKKPTFLLSASEQGKELLRGTRNIPSAVFLRPQDLNLKEVLAKKFLIFTKDAVSVIEKTFVK